MWLRVKADSLEDTKRNMQRIVLLPSTQAKSELFGVCAQVFQLTLSLSLSLARYNERINFITVWIGPERDGWCSAFCCFIYYTCVILSSSN